MDSLSQKTQELIENQFTEIENNGVSVYSKDENEDKLTPSIVLRIDYFDAQKLFDYYQRLLPEYLRDNLLKQPVEGLHITIQWYDKKFHNQELEDAVIEFLDKNIDKIEKEVPVFFPVFGLYSVWAAIEEDYENRIVELRSNLNDVLENNGANSGIKEERNFLSYINLARYESDIEREVEELKRYSKNSMKLHVSSVDYIHADKFITDKSEVIKSWKVN